MRPITAWVVSPLLLDLPRHDISMVRSIGVFLAIGLSTAVACARVANPIGAFALILCATALATGALLDAWYLHVPDRVQALGCTASVLWVWYAWHASENPVAYVAGALEAMGIPVGLWVITGAFERWTGRDALGLADIKVLLWLAPLLGSAVAVASVVLVATATGLLASRKLTQTQAFAFLPSLAVGYSVAVLFF